MSCRPVVSGLLVLMALSILLATAPAGAQVTALTLGQDKPSPQQVGTTVTFTANASGGSGPYEYKFWLAKGPGAYAPVSPNYVPGNTMVWTPTEADSYKVMVYARRQGSTALFEKSVTKTGYWVVTEAPVTAVSMSATKASPQQVGTTVTFTATATSGGGTGVEYQFLLAKGGGAYSSVKEYAEPGNTWTPGPGEMDVADSYVVKANARRQGSIAPFEKFVTKNYALIADAPVKSVTLTTDKTSPQDLATVGTVTFTAVATPGAPGDAVEYQFWLYTSASAKYEPVGDVTTGYSAANTWHWTPTVADTYYKVMVYARTVGNTVAYEKLRVVFFTIFFQPPTLGDVTPSVLTSPADSCSTLSAVYSDAGGYEVLKTASLLVNETESEANGIFVEYNRSTGKLHLANDAGTAYVGNCVPGSAVTLTNSQGSLNCAGSSVAGSGDDLTVNWSIIPKAAFVSTTAKNVYTHAKDISNVHVGWADKGDWTITAAIDFADCVGCHGAPPNAGNDGGSGDDAPNVMGNGTNATGTGTTPKPFDDGTWGYNVNGHGANGTASMTIDTDFGGGINPLNSNSACADCHALQAHHYDGVLDGVSGSAGTCYLNTYHLRTNLTYPYVNAADADTSLVQLRFDNACYRNCHQGAGISRGTHGSNPVAGVTQFGRNGSTVLDGESLLWPVDSDITTRAGTGGTDYAVCSTCHNVHGTSVVDSVPSNRMLRAKFRSANDLCINCHL